MDPPLCPISYEPLDGAAVVLDCGHAFCFDAIYAEVCAQKFKHRTYGPRTFGARKTEHYVRCPYCRAEQPRLLPATDGGRFGVCEGAPFSAADEERAMAAGRGYWYRRTTWFSDDVDCAAPDCTASSCALLPPGTPLCRAHFFTTRARIRRKKPPLISADRHSFPPAAESA